MSSRFHFLTIAALHCAGAILIISAAQAAQAAPAIHPQALPQGGTHVLPASDRGKFKQCLALRKCRAQYTTCFNKIEKNFKPERWSDERTKCVDTYKVCIDKNFPDGGMLFTRWFVPEANCDQYR